MEKVESLLRRNAPQFNTIRTNRSIYDALHQMQCENVDYLIIMEDHLFLGVFTEHRLAEKIVRHRDLEHASVKEFMTEFLPVTTPDDSLQHCMQLMEQYNVRHLAVYEGIHFKGIVSSHALMKQVLLKRRDIFSD
jgi:predicted transcriptional regulator